MRALHFSTNPELGGGERQVLALLTQSAARGVEAELLTTAGAALEPLARDAGIAVHRLTRRFAYDPVAIVRAARLLRKRAASVLHVHDGSAASIGVFAARRAGVPVLVHRRVASPLRTNPLTRAKYSPARVARYVAVSEVVAAVLRAAGIPAEKIRVVPSGVDLSRLRTLARGAGRAALPPQLRGSRPLLGTVGKLAPKKGMEDVLRAFARIRRAHGDAALLVVGGGPDECSLRGLANELGIAAWTQFTGSVPDAAPLVADLDAFLFASALEGSPGVLREAMALGVPIVTVDTPGCVEVVADTAVTTPRGDPTALAEGAIQLLADAERRERLRKAASERVAARFSLESMVAATLEVAREAAGNSPKGK